MPLVVDQLQIWTIGFKWAGLDPNRLWLRIPTSVKDNFSTLFEAILNQHLDCISLMTEKYQGDDPESARFYIRSWLDDVYAAINGRHFNKKLLRHAVIERGSFQEWCTRCSIPLPDFWFPPGWTDYRWPEDDFEPIPERPTDTVAVATSPIEDVNQGEPGPLGITPPPEDNISAATKLKPSHLARVVSQQIAKVIWKDEPEMTITAMAKHELVLKYGGGHHYSEDVVRRWVKEVAPDEVSAKRGRPKKKNPTDGS